MGTVAGILTPPPAPHLPSNAPDLGGDDGGLEDLLASRGRSASGGGDRGRGGKRGRSASAGAEGRSFKRERKVRVCVCDTRW